MSGLGNFTVLQETLVVSSARFKGEAAGQAVNIHNQDLRQTFPERPSDFPHTIDLNIYVVHDNCYRHSITGITVNTTADSLFDIIDGVRYKLRQ